MRHIVRRRESLVLRQTGRLRNRDNLLTEEGDGVGEEPKLTTARRPPGYPIGTLDEKIILQAHNLGPDNNLLSCQFNTFNIYISTFKRYSVYLNNI